MFSLTTTHLRFVCEATTPLRLEQDIFRAGSNLRGALGQVMLRSYCAGNRDDSQHAAMCPVHWLLAANEKPGVERRGYALVPPLPNGGGDVPPEGLCTPGDTFEFGLTLFGNTLQFLPYFILAVPEMGRLGIGPGRGRFVLKRVWALNPLSGESECLFGDASSRTRDSMGNMRDDASGENGNVVRMPTLVVDQAGVEQIADSRWQIADSRWQMADGKSQIANRNALSAIRHQPLAIEFLTPMRLIHNDRTVKMPEFVPLFARLLERLDELAEQFGTGDGGRETEDGGRKTGDGRRGTGGGRAREEIGALRACAAQVEMREVNTRWVEVFSGSARRGMASPLSGFVGRAVYSAPCEVWKELLPWLLWGQLAQVGKGTVKGNGVMRIGMRDEG